MTIAYTLATDVLLLTGGTSGTNLTPANIISDATAYSAASTYALGAIVKQDNGDGIGISLWRCSTAITVAEAWTYSKWTRIAWIANKTLRLTAVLDIGAYYNDTGWNYETTKMLRTATGVKWTSGSVDSTSQLIGFKLNHSGSYTDAGWKLFNGGGSTDFVNWTRCEIFKASTSRADISLTNTTLPVTIRNLTIDGRAGFGDNHNLALSVASDVDGINFYYCNLGITPIANLKNIGHLGLFIESPQNKVGILTSGSILKNYSPSLPTDLSRLVGLISGTANQYLQDIVVPSGFLLSTVQAYFATTSAYFTRTVAFTFKQGTILLGNVYVYGYKTGSPSTQIYAGLSNATTAIYTTVAQVFYGNRSATAGGSYVALQNTIDWTDQTVLFRRVDLIEATYQQDMNVNGVTLTQFMQADELYTSDQSTNTTIAINYASSQITISGVNTLDAVYDYVKWWLTQNMSTASFMTGSGTTVNFGAFAIVIASGGALNVGTKLDSLSTAGLVTVNSGGSIGVTYTDSTGPHVKLTISGMLVGSDVVITDTSAPDGTGSNVLQTFDNVTSTSVEYSYIYSAGTNINIHVYKAGYVDAHLQNYTLSPTAATAPISQLRDRAYV